MARTDKPGTAGRGPRPQQLPQPGNLQQAPVVRPPGTTAGQFATVGGYVMQQMPGTTMPQQLAQQAAAAGGRPALIALPGQPGGQFLLNPALGQQQANLQALYAQQLQAMHAMQAQQAAQQAARPQLAGVQAGAGMRSAGPAGQPQPAQSGAQSSVQQPARPAVPMVPPTNFTISLRMPSGEVRPYQIPAEFLKAHPNEWQAWVTNPALHMEMWQRFSAWHAAANRNTVGAAGIRPASMPPAAKRAKQDAGPAVAMGVRPQQLPTHMHPAAMRTPSPGLPPGQQQPAQPQPPMTAAAAGAAAQAALQQRIAAGTAGGVSRMGFPPITKPTNEEDKLFLPKPRLQALVREACGQGARLTSDAEQALKSLAQDFVANAVAFGVSMARRRKGEVLEQADLQLYFERTWNLQIPGFSDAEVRPYRRPAASEIHRARMAAVRRSAAEASAARQDAAAAAATAPTAGIAAPAAAAPAAAAAPECAGAAKEAESEGRGAAAAPPASTASAPAGKGGEQATGQQQAGGAVSVGAPPPGVRRGSASPANKVEEVPNLEGTGGRGDDEDMPDVG